MHSYPTRNFGLDAIRVLAIVLVVLSHCTYIAPKFNTTITDVIRLLGATGVDIFFVLSGYLIGGILLRKLNTHDLSFKSLVHFWKRRWFRTLPNYFVVLILNILLILLLGQTFINSSWKYILFIQNFINTHPNFFTESWSLSIEEYAYLFLPLIIYTVLVLFKRFKPSRVFFISTILVIGILFLFKIQFYNSVVINDYQSWSSQFRKVVLYRLDAIYYGFVLVYLMSKYDVFKSYKKTFLWLGVLTFSFLHVILFIYQISPDNSQLFFSLFYLPLISLSIAFVFPFFVALNSKNKICGIITYISTRSYSIYLVNYSIVLLTFQHFFSASLLVMFVYCAVTLVLSEILYRSVELPFLRLRDKIVPRK